MDARSNLEQSMNEEASAVQDYTTRASVARSEGDEVSARLWEHVAKEEEGHYFEFRDRLNALRAKAQLESETTYRKTTLPGVGEIQEVSTELPGGGRITSIIGYGWHREARPFPKTYGDWVNLAEDIKTKDPTTKMSVNSSLQHIIADDELADVSKRWLVQKAGELGIT